MRILRSLFMAPILLLAGCATILGSRSQAVTINSEPPGSSVLITDEHGDQVYKGVTPARVVLEKSSGHYFGAKKYHVDFSLPGYSDKEVILSESPNGWYYCNILLGGVIGMVAVDPWNGGMWSLSQDDVHPVLQKQADATPAPTTSKTD